MPGFGVDRRRFLQFSAAGLATVFGPGQFTRTVQAKDAGESSLIVRTQSPMNAEPALEDLVSDWITPTKFFYVRSHAPNPVIDPNNYRLKVEGLVEKPLDLSLAELKQQFKQHSTVATMTCAGNRRAEYSQIKPVGGVQWGAGAVGNAKWDGVRLSDVLKAAGLKEDAKHVWFEGLDAVPHGQDTIPFGGSIPVLKALADSDSMPGAMLSHRMNGQPLSADHGFPLRSVVPGYIGARSVKWLGKIVVSNRPSPNHYVADAYKLVTKNTPLAWEESGVLYNYLLNSVIADPSPHAKVQGNYKVRGYALPAGDGSQVDQVEVWTDTARKWTQAKLLSKPKPYCWVLWEADVSISADTTRFIVKATDSKGHTQPQTVPWNLKGYMNNAWYHLPINGKN